jgi:hypothetical protein
LVSFFEIAVAAKNVSVRGVAVTPFGVRNRFVWPLDLIAYRIVRELSTATDFIEATISRPWLHPIPTGPPPLRRHNRWILERV